MYTIGRFSKFMKLAQTGTFHSGHCSRISRKVKIMWPEQDRSFLKPACFLQSNGSTAIENQLRITLLKTLLVTDNRLIPLQLLQWLRSSFLGSFAMNPDIQSFGNSPFSHKSLKILESTYAMVFPLACNISAFIPSASGAFPLWDSWLHSLPHLRMVGLCWCAVRLYWQA